ncbi:MAG: tRNA (adenosine(37)-N6)-dimethylallyltransferase MiaA [Bacteroidales bacterium]|nr:tRNA (adenosine(37)-N6)-dimethylallyltransferase MiaA [Bacteroidales bacterium]
MGKNLVVIAGPTGVGKSAVAVRLARHFHTELVSGDSRQIFRELRIGTAPPPDSDLQAVPHHLVYSHSLHDSYNADSFEKDALKILAQLFEYHDIVILVGGSMLYLDALCNGMDELPAATPEIRTQLAKLSLEELQNRLRIADPDYYSTVDRNNRRRITRALEVCLTAGKAYSSLRTNNKKERPFGIIKIGLNIDRKALHERINRRVDAMIDAGLEAEARRVMPLRHLNSLNTVGYKELFSYFDGTITREAAIELIKRNTRRYARRQLTWFRADPDIRWFSPDQYADIISYIGSAVCSQESEN